MFFSLFFARSDVNLATPGAPMDLRPGLNTPLGRRPGAQLLALLVAREVARCRLALARRASPVSFTALYLLLLLSRPMPLLVLVPVADARGIG